LDKLSNAFLPDKVLLLVISYVKHILEISKTYLITKEKMIALLNPHNPNQEGLCISIEGGAKISLLY
jgi:hypothetical protein